MIRSPMIVWRRMNAHSCSSSGPGFSRIASGTAALPMSCSVAACRTAVRCSSLMPSPRAVCSASAATPSTCSPRSGLRSAMTFSSTAVLWPPAEARRPFFSAYMRRSAVRRASAGSQSGRSSTALPSAALIVEAVAVLAEGRAARRRDLVVAAGGEHAELVAAHPVGAAVAVDGRGQRPAEAREQGVARGMAVGVVVGLEAVEVEEHEQQRPLGRDAAQPGSRGPRPRRRRLPRPVSSSVCASPRLVPSRLMCSPSVSQSRTPATASVAKASTTAMSLARWKWSTSSRTSAAAMAPKGRTSSRRPSSRTARARSSGCQAPSAVASAEAGHSHDSQAGDVGLAVGDRAEVDDVGGAAEHEPHAHERQRPVGPPAGERERADHQHQQQDVADGIGEVRRPPRTARPPRSWRGSAAARARRSARPRPARRRSRRATGWRGTRGSAGA